MTDAEKWLWSLRRLVAEEYRTLRRERDRIRREEAIRLALEERGLPADAVIDFSRDTQHGEAEIVLPGGSPSVWVRWDGNLITGFAVIISEGLRVFRTHELVHAIKFAFSLDLDIDECEDDDGDDAGDGDDDDAGDGVASVPLLQVAVVTGGDAIELQNSLNAAIANMSAQGHHVRDFAIRQGEDLWYAAIAYFWYPPS